MGVMSLPVGDINLTTPALLFPAVSLLMLAYTNRFLALAALIRSLHASHKQEPDPVILAQIASLRGRVFLIRNMQALGVCAILLCAVSMFLLFAGFGGAARGAFGASLLSLMASLALSLREIQISVVALNLNLQDIEGEEQRGAL